MSRKRKHILPGFGLTMGITTLLLSLIVYLQQFVLSGMIPSP